MSISSINLETLVSNAYYCKKYFSYDQYVNQAVDLIYQGFYNFDFDGGALLDKYKNINKDPAFTIVHNYLTFFICDNNGIYQTEYQTYCKVCEKCGHKFFSTEELVDFYKSFSKADARGTFSFIRLLREQINSSFFQNFIYGMIMLSLMDTGELRQSSYELIQVVLSPSVDNCPPYNTLMSKVYKW